MHTVNVAVTVLVNLAILGLLTWLVGGWILRFAGWGFALFGLAVIATRAGADTATIGTYLLGLGNVLVGAACWLLGHAPYAAKHHHWRSSTAHGIARRLHLARGAHT